MAKSKKPSVYNQFIESKRVKAQSYGFSADIDHDWLNGFQKNIVRDALEKGRYAVFADTGLGKTRIQIAFADAVVKETGKPFLILTPLAVAAQTVAEAKSVGVDAARVQSGAEVTGAKIYVTNYDRLKDFDTSVFGGVALDESSILKSFMGATKRALVDAFAQTPYRLALTATPSPNDHTELGNHAEFLGVMSMQSMLARWFVHDSSDTSKWRLKGHAREEFWMWVASWAVGLRMPSDLRDDNGVPFSDDGYILPPLEYTRHIVDSEPPDGQLFAGGSLSATGLHGEMRKTAEDRAIRAAEIVAAEPDEQWLVWCNTDYEAKELMARIPGAVEIAGPMSVAVKEDRLMGFPEGRIQILVTKPSVAGHGMNYQNCARMVFVGLSYSFEQLYQAVRRCYRYGQKRTVHAHIISAESEQSVLTSIDRKAKDHETMVKEMVSLMGKGQKAAEQIEAAGEDRTGEGWRLLRGDCVARLKDVADNSIDYSVFSPPFASLYTYSDMPEDMGNCKDEQDFFDHFKFLMPELFRALKPGRLMSMHCMDLPATKERDGYIGLKDFPAMLRAAAESAGFIYHSKVCIWKDPVVAMQRTKAIGLLYKQLRKDSCISRQGIADYIVTLRKPGENEEPVTKTYDSFPVDRWQRYASPVWMDIDQGKVLPFTGARAEKDERHICPLQLEVIERCVELWSNPGDVVLSPFAGVGSEGYTALRMDREFVGVELKESYFKQGVMNLARAVELGSGQLSLLDETSEPSNAFIDDPMNGPDWNKQLEYVDEIALISKARGFSIGHEDNHGAFKIEPYSDENVKWLRGAVEVPS